MADADISADILRMEFTYNPQTGVFTRRGEDKPSGRIATKGYRQIFIFGKRYMAHRLAWLYINGQWPVDQLDHINRNKDDNRIDNLREVSNKQNQENIPHWSHNKSGRRGVRFRKGRWLAEIVQHKRKIHIGSFDNIIDAVAARMRAERTIFTHAPFITKLLTVPQPIDFIGGSIVAPGTKHSE